MQTRIGSAVEAIANVLVGFGVGWGSNLIVLPIFGFHVNGTQAFEIGLYMTAISLARSYLLRRLFTRWRRWEA